MFYPWVIFFSYLSSVCLSMFPLGQNNAGETQKEHVLGGGVEWGQQKHSPTHPCYHGRTLEAEAAPCWQCAGPAYIRRVPEPSPFSLMTLQLPRVPQGRCAEGATVGLHPPPPPPRAFGSAVKAGVGDGDEGW